MELSLYRIEYFHWDISFFFDFSIQIKKIDFLIYFTEELQLQHTMTTHSKFYYPKEDKDELPNILNGFPIVIIQEYQLNNPDYTQGQTMMLVDIYNKIKTMGGVNVLLEFEVNKCRPLQTDPDKYEPISNWWDLFKILDWSPSVEVNMTKTVNTLERTTKGVIDVMSEKDINDTDNPLVYLGKIE